MLRKISEKFDKARYKLRAFFFYFFVHCHAPRSSCPPRKNFLVIIKKLVKCSDRQIFFEKIMLISWRVAHEKFLLEVKEGEYFLYARQKRFSCRCNKCA